MASCALGELIPCAFVWYDPGITPCCKSPKLPGDKILAIRRTNRRPPIYAASVTLPSSPARSSSGNEVPHIFTRKSRLQPGEFLVTSAKRLLQHNLPSTSRPPETWLFLYNVRAEGAFSALITAHAMRRSPYDQRIRAEIVGKD